MHKKGALPGKRNHYSYVTCPANFPVVQGPTVVTQLHTASADAPAQLVAAAPEREMNWLQQAVFDSRNGEPTRRAFDASSQCPGMCVRAWAFLSCVLHGAIRCFYLASSRRTLG